MKDRSQIINDLKNKYEDRETCLIDAICNVSEALMNICNLLDNMYARQASLVSTMSLVADGLLENKKEAEAREAELKEEIKRVTDTVINFIAAKPVEVTGVAQATTVASTEIPF